MSIKILLSMNMIVWTYISYVLLKVENFMHNLLLHVREIWKMDSVNANVTLPQQTTVAVDNEMNIYTVSMRFVDYQWYKNVVFSFVTL